MNGVASLPPLQVCASSTDQVSETGSGKRLKQLLRLADAVDGGKTKPRKSAAKYSHRKRAALPTPRQNGGTSASTSSGDDARQRWLPVDNRSCPSLGGELLDGAQQYCSLERAGSWSAGPSAKLEVVSDEARPARCGQHASSGLMLRAEADLALPGAGSGGGRVADRDAGVGQRGSGKLCLNRLSGIHAGAAGPYINGDNELPDLDTHVSNPFCALNQPAGCDGAGQGVAIVGCGSA